jgi:chemotaxis protein methyltransferase CheR
MVISRLLNRLPLLTPRGQDVAQWEEQEDGVMATDANMLALAQFKRRIFDLSGYNLAHYKSEELDRRLLCMMERAACTNLDDFFAFLTTQPGQLDNFLDSLTNNTSEFYRNPERFRELKMQILPHLLGLRRRLRIWSAGCSIGAEIYSLVMILDRLGLAEQTYFLATDVDQRVLEKARQGRYEAHHLTHVPRNELTHYFTPVQGPSDELLYEFKPVWRNRVHFVTHDLLQEAYPQYFDLIICRNVMIYFNREAKVIAYSKFFESLKDHGVLFVGGTERMMNEQDIGYHRILPFFYSKVPGPISSRG